MAAGPLEGAGSRSTATPAAAPRELLGQRTARQTVAPPLCAQRAPLLSSLPSGEPSRAAADRVRRRARPGRPARACRPCTRRNAKRRLEASRALAKSPSRFRPGPGRPRLSPAKSSAGVRCFSTIVESALENSAISVYSPRENRPASPSAGPRGQRPRERGQESLITRRS